MGRTHTHHLRVRYSECDMQGHVFNAHWLAYFDVAYTELWREAVGGWGEVTARGIDLVVAEANVSYRSPGRFDDEIAIAVQVERLGTSSITSAFTATRVRSPTEASLPAANDAAAADDLLVEGRMIHVVVGTEDYRKREIPDWVREALG